MLLSICTLIAITGAIYVAHGHALMTNYFWFVSNIGFIIHNILIYEYEMVLLFIVYEIISIYGIWNLTQNKRYK